MTLEEAKRNAAQLKADAEELLEKFKIQHHLRPLGEVELRGSALHDLMVRYDLDFNIYSDDPKIEKAAEVAKGLMTLPDMAGVQVNNHYVVPPTPGKPVGIYIGIKPYFKGNVWIIDGWYLKREDVLNQVAFGAAWWKEVRPEQKDTMLLLKATLHEQGRYAKEFFSADVYRAVNDDGVKTIEDLEVWRQFHEPH